MRALNSLLRDFRTHWTAWLFVVCCSLAIALWMIHSTAWPLMDSRYYQAFTEALALGQLDFSIIGFHGADIPAALWHRLFPAELSQIHFQSFIAVFLPLLAFLAGRSIYRDTQHGILLAAMLTMMPFVPGVALIGYSQPFYTAMLFLAIIGAAHSSRWTGLSWGFAMITKPFAFALAPLLYVLQPHGKKRVWSWSWLWIGLLIPLIYLAAQYMQTGSVTVGVHPEFTALNIWQAPRKFLLNLAYALQILFSIHNYHYPNPAGTGHDNLMHTTPVLIFLGIFALLKPKIFFTNQRLPLALAVVIAINFLTNAAMATMDHGYMEVGIWMILIASIPVLIAYPLWIPIALATLHFQYFYFFLWMGKEMQLDAHFLLPVAVVDIAFAIWALRVLRHRVVDWRQIKKFVSSRA